MQTETLTIVGMSCRHCVAAIEHELNKLKLAQFTVSLGRVEVTYDEKIVRRSEIISAIQAAGYDVTI